MRQPINLHSRHVSLQLSSQWWCYDNSYHICNLKLAAKAGRFVGKAGCYAVLVLADNATFSLAVNCMAAYRTQPANRSHYTYLCPLWHMRSERNYPISVSVERATPIPHSLTTCMSTEPPWCWFAANLTNMDRSINRHVSFIDLICYWEWQTLIIEHHTERPKIRLSCFCFFVNR